MNKRKGFTLIELLVVIAIIALLMSILMPALAKVRSQAKAVVCQANQKQFGLAFAMYVENNNGYLGAGFGTGPPSTGGHKWPITLEPFYRDRKMLLCPMANKSANSVIGSKFKAWDYSRKGGVWTFDSSEGYLGSYGINEWVSNTDARVGGLFGASKFWRTANVKEARSIPILMDGAHPGHYPTPGSPPEYDGEMVDHAIKFFCLNRHSGHINILKLDFSVQKTGLKQLWTFEWHRGCDTENAYTILGHGGGTTGRADCALYWDSKAEWMKNFKEY